MMVQQNLLFPASEFRASELRPEEIEELQHFFEANPEFFLAVEGRPAKPSEAEEEFHDAPPPSWSYTKCWVMGFRDKAGAMVGMATVISDLLAQKVWHIGLFMVATARFGSGDARTLYQGLEAWTKQNGAEWLRLGVVVGNARAERFWEKMGFTETRKREGVEMGNRINTVRYMAKPLAGGSLADYLALVARDRPEA